MHSIFLLAYSCWGRKLAFVQPLDCPGSSAHLPDCADKFFHRQEAACTTSSASIPLAQTNTCSVLLPKPCSYFPSPLCGNEWVGGGSEHMLGWKVADASVIP